MKRKTSFILAFFSIAAGLFFTNCQKEQNASTSISPNSSLTSATYYTRFSRQSDRIDEIVKDLALDQYSLHFDRAIPSAGITRTAYGADNYLVFADPQDLICPDPIRIRQKYIPIWKIPNFIPPTCPDMIIDINKFEQIYKVVANADPAQFGSLKQIALINGGALMAGEKFTGQYANLRTDKFDELTSDLDPTRYIMFNAPGNFDGVFTRDAYGYADLAKYVFPRYKVNLKDLIKPTLKGCFDPLILEIIRKRLIDVNPETYKGLDVTLLGEDAGMLSF
jgi:hypothetical protein